MVCFWLIVIKVDFLVKFGIFFIVEGVDISGIVELFIGFFDSEFVFRMIIMDKFKWYLNIDVYVVNDDYMRFNFFFLLNMLIEFFL